MARAMKDSGIAWIGEIPEEWGIKKLKYCSSFIQDKYDDTYGDLSYIGLENIVSWNGKHIETESQYDKSQSLVFHKNDILWGKLRPYLAKVYHCTEVGCCSGEFCVIRIDDEYDTRYFWNLLISSEFVATIDRSTYGTKMPRANADFIRNTYIPIPPVGEQKRIAQFLDNECARIDAVIEQTRASIEEYKKLKQAVITQAVTKGICPNRPMKDSGVEWIGEVPADWEVYRIANLYDERNESGNDDLPILTISINSGISDHEVDDEEQTRVFVRTEDRTKYKRVYPGDLAYNMMRAWQGAFGAVRVDGMISPAYVVAQPKSLSVLDSRYVEALLRTPSAIEEMHRYSHGITDFRLRLYWPEFKNIRICVPPIEEQNEIADYIDVESKRIDDVLFKKEQFINEFEIYKKVLIYEYVTGKKEVIRMRDYLHEIFLDSVKKVIEEMQSQGFTQKEILEKVEKNTEKALDSIIEKSSTYAVDFMKEHMFEIFFEWEANDAEFCARQDQKWGKCFAASRVMYESSIDAAIQYSNYVQDMSTSKDFSSKQFTYLSLQHLHGRACQEFLEIMTLLRNGFADGAYARCRSMYEICCIASFIREQGEPIAKQFYDQANSDYNARSYQWANTIKDANGKKVNSFGQIQKMCNMAQPWLDGYDMTCLLNHASPQGTFGRIANAKETNVISVGRSDYGIKIPAEHSALCLQWITALFLTLFPHTDSMSRAKAISKWSQVLREMYYSTHDVIFPKIAKAQEQNNVKGKEEETE